MSKNFIAASIIFLFASSAWSHEGHGAAGQEQTVAHYIMDPLHLPLLLVLCLAVIGIATVTRKYFNGALRVTRG